MSSNLRIDADLLDSIFRGLQAFTVQIANISILTNNVLTSDSAAELNANVRHISDETSSEFVEPRNINESVQTDDDDIIFIEPVVPVIDLTSPFQSNNRRRNRRIETSEVIEIEDSFVCDEQDNNNNESNIILNSTSTSNSRTSLKCSICLNTPSSPNTTICGHIFCENCIKRALQSSKVCPMCKRKNPKLIKLFI